MFDTEQFIADCEAAVAADSSHVGVRDIVARAVSDPAAVLKGLGEPKAAGVQKIHNSDTLTIINVIWAPWMTIMPHNHEMWAVIGVYTGREDNMFWRRVEGASDGHIEAAGAIHVYGGNFFDMPRSEWDAETLTEQPYDVEKNMRLFQEFGTA